MNVKCFISFNFISQSRSRYVVQYVSLFLKWRRPVNQNRLRAWYFILTNWYFLPLLTRTSLPSVFSFFSQSDCLGFPFLFLRGLSNLYLSPLSISIVVVRKHQASLPYVSITIFERPLLNVVDSHSHKFENSFVAPLWKSFLALLSRTPVIHDSPSKPIRLN